MCVCGVSKWANLSGSAEKFHKGKSKTNFPLTILIRMGEGFLQFVGSIHNSGWGTYHDSKLEVVNSTDSVDLT